MRHYRKEPVVEKNDWYTRDSVKKGSLQKTENIAR